jgi:hypothetical protein
MARYSSAMSNPPSASALRNQAKKQFNFGPRRDFHLTGTVCLR